MVLGGFAQQSQTEVKAEVKKETKEKVQPKSTTDDNSKPTPTPNKISKRVECFPNKTVTTIYPTKPGEKKTVTVKTENVEIQPKRIEENK